MSNSSRGIQESVDGMDEQFAADRATMVREHLAARDITNREVLVAMRNVPRHLFVPEHLRSVAYSDQALPIGHRQTISQPYIVALMSQLADVGPDSRVLDIGTGSGYQAAIMAEICREVYSIEIVESLGREAERRLADLGYANVEVRVGDGYQGWPDKAPFDAIIVAAAPSHIPAPLVEQLAAGGRLVIPVGDYHQDLIVIEKHTDGTIEKRKVAAVAFVPMTGEAEYSTREK